MRTLIILLVVVISACSTQAQRDRSRMNDRAVQLGDEVSSCVGSVWGHQEVATISGKMARQGKATLGQLGDNSFATEQDVAAITKFYELMQHCRSMWTDGYMEIAPAIVPVSTESYAQADIVYVALIKREMNWGDANKEFVQIYNRTRTKLRRTAERIDQRLDASHESEMASRRAAADAIDSYRPVVCQTGGSTIICF